MPFLTNSVPKFAIPTGSESVNFDTNISGGGQPQMVSIELTKLALLMSTFTNGLSKTMVAGTIYYSQYNVGFVYDPTPLGSNISENTFLTTGVNIVLGTPGGTDTWHAGLWNSSGVLVARSATAGVTAGTALTTQQIPWAGVTGSATGADAPVSITAGTYYIGLQSNGTTAKFWSINSPIWPLPTGSQSGSAGTLPAISSVATTYTANLGPQATLY